MTPGHLLNVLALNERAVHVLCAELEKALLTYHDRTSQVLIKSIVEALVKNYSVLSLERLVSKIHEFAILQKQCVTT